MSEPSPIFRRADRLIDELAAADPFYATFLGVDGSDDRMKDYSPPAQHELAEISRRALDDIRAMPPTNDDDRLAAEFIVERLTAELAAFDAGEWMRDLSAIGGPNTQIREIFDLMPRATAEQWTNIAARLEGVPAALDGFRQTLLAGLDAGRASTVRQAHSVAEQAETWVSARWFDTLAAEAGEAGLEPALVARLEAGATGATAAYASLAAFLRDEYAPRADVDDASGIERYRLNVRLMTGADLDPEEMYAWGWTEYASLRDQIVATCAEIKPGASFAEVVELLETDPARLQPSVAAYRDWLQALTDEALARSAEYFDIPEVMNRCDVMIPPEGSAAAAHYMPPSEDFSRAGSTWYPTMGRTKVPTWSDVSTCYHESVPGHHLQIAYAMVQGDRLSRFQRNSFISGHGEGWALYAERLCDEMGWFSNPDHRLGFLCGQQLRAVRVVIDIGMHLKMRIPDDARTSDGELFHPGEVWTPELALDFSSRETGNTREYMRSEIDRYLSWPAQAITYKIGEREWLKARAAARQRLGDRFDLRGFHTFALALGPIGLDQLQAELARYEPAP